MQVKTTQPRRYLVRPNQGLIAPGGVEEVQILLVEKDKAQLLSSFASLGMAALDNCKDKFLVQSTAVTPDQARNLADYERLTGFWSTSPTPVANKKLHVRHTVDSANDASAASSAVAPPPTSYANLDPTNMTMDQLVPELKAVRRKYDELVAFSVNLTAERDMLSNSLEQTKRDLQRATASAMAANRNNATAALSSTLSKQGTAQPARSGSSSSRLGFLLFFGVFSVLVGMQLPPLVPPQYQHINRFLANLLDDWGVMDSPVVTGGPTKKQKTETEL